ncbi:PilZ domain-containing protein [Marinobacter daqiaonensis]|uniref:Cyclic diguanosine monophosphate-binding protein n=1 Tax=Marinobacter daqiaonensis TaxID=650891 RepID=A0A1I6K441_9GAMM|nr:PilZ domain-containing protein [Marinobacter daqiaonensis]SFR86011.1 PilZ domain-containing protein [Marinobacter daqiaonensis]
MEEKKPEKRRFQRIQFDAPCELYCREDMQTAEVLDISLKGVLVSRPAGWVASQGDSCELTIHLNDHESAIVVAATLRHLESDRLGFKIDYIDLESASHLKRLVELNLGDAELLERELLHLLR